MEGLIDEHRGSSPAPGNSATITMDMFDLATINSLQGWTMRDKTRLWKQLEKMTKNLKIKDIHLKIAELKRERITNTLNDRKCIGKKIILMRKELNEIYNQKLDDIALPIEEDYDWEEVANSLGRRHNPIECQALWKLYLHPSINKSKWSEKEHQLLQKLASEHGPRNWDLIAKKMGNIRTGYQCSEHIRINKHKIDKKKWSDEEVGRLSLLVDRFKVGNYIPWAKVAAAMKNRTKGQVYDKYSKLCVQRKGRFLPEEDAVILTCADDFGSNYKKMTQFLLGRSAAQIRVRHQALVKNRVSTVWTIKEDRKLLRLLSDQDKSGNYANITKYFPGKDRIQIRARHVTLVKWMKLNPDDDISLAPRRGARRLGHGKASNNLNVAVKTLKTRILTEPNKKT